MKFKILILSVIFLNLATFCFSNSNDETDETDKTVNNNSDEFESSGKFKSVVEIIFEFYFKMYLSLLISFTDSEHGQVPNHQFLYREHTVKRGPKAGEKNDKVLLVIPPYCFRRQRDGKYEEDKAYFVCKFCEF